VNDFGVMCEAISGSGLSDRIRVVLLGCKRGPGVTARTWAELNNIPVNYFPLMKESPKGNKNGMPHVTRNKALIKNADALIALWDGESWNTAHVIYLAQKKGIRLYVHLVKPPK